MTNCFFNKCIPPLKCDIDTKKHLHLSIETHLSKPWESWDLKTNGLEIPEPYTVKPVCRRVQWFLQKHHLLGLYLKFPEKGCVFSLCLLHWLFFSFPLSQEQMEKPTLVTKGGVGYGVDETQKVVEFWQKTSQTPKTKQTNLGA